MRLTLDPRAARLLRRLPRSFPYAVAEVLLLALIAIQVARFLWAVTAPVGPFGDWRPARSGAIGADSALLARFDPFFRLSGAAQAAVVTSLSLKLYGTRVDSATGRGSAIIATPDGIQSSYAVGDEIVPGVKLKAVSFDGVTIDRGGAPEQLFLDQSVVAPVVQPTAAASSPPLVAVPAPVGTATAPALAPTPGAPK